MGAVYRALDTRLNAPVAVKEMAPQPGLSPQVLEGLRNQFRQEATVLANLDHPHLVDVLDFFEEAGNAYLVMRFVAGESLGARIRRLGACFSGRTNFLTRSNTATPEASCTAISNRRMW